MPSNPTIGMTDERKWSNAFRRKLEQMAVDGYRAGTLDGNGVRRLLRLRSLVEVHAFLKQAGVYLDYKSAA